MSTERYNVITGRDDGSIINIPSNNNSPYSSQTITSSHSIKLRDSSALKHMQVARFNDMSISARDGYQVVSVVPVMLALLYHDATCVTEELMQRLVFSRILLKHSVFWIEFQVAYQEVCDFIIIRFPMISTHSPLDCYVKRSGPYKWNLLGLDFIMVSFHTNSCCCPN